MPLYLKLRPKDTRRLLVLMGAEVIILMLLSVVTGNVLLAFIAVIASAIFALMFLPQFKYVRLKYIPLWMRSRNWKMRMHLSSYQKD